MSPSQVEFSASYDRSTKVISTAACALLIAVSLVAQQAFALCASILIIGLVFAYSPRGYTISDRAVIVRRLIGNVRFELQGIREARRATADDLRWTIRLWGSGGMFGYYGLYRTSKLGNCSWYVTNRGNMIAIVTDARTALFSPDDVEGFLAAIRAWAPVSAAPEGPDATSRPRSTFPSASWIGIALGALALALAAFAFLYSPGPPSYTLTPDGLTIHDRFYPVTVKAAEVDVAQARIIDITNDAGWRPAMRTNGFANAHYRSGWFKVANGQKVRAYWASASCLVLLPPKEIGVPVLLEVKDPSRFIGELRREWGLGTQ